MKINVVTVQSGWILQKIAERIAEAGKLIYGTSWNLTHAPIPDADVYFYCDVQNCWSGYIYPANRAKHTGLFTHVHADDIKYVNRNVMYLDHIFHMAPRYLSMFKKQLGYPSTRMSLMVPFESQWKPRRLKLGIFQRGKHEGKGFDFLKKFAVEHKELCDQFDWMFVGNDWDEVVDLLQYERDDDIEYYGDSIDYPDAYESCYDSIDYLLIPSLWEGGPISCLEAVSKGIPIIAADVGWCNQWVEVTKRFEPGNAKQLAGILSGLDAPRRARYSMLLEESYLKCATQIVEVANR